MLSLVGRGHLVSEEDSRTPEEMNRKATIATLQILTNLRTFMSSFKSGNIERGNRFSRWQVRDKSGAFGWRGGLPNTWRYKGKGERNPSNMDQLRIIENFFNWGKIGHQRSSFS